MPLKVLHTLPIIKGMTGIAKTMGNMFQLLQVQAEVCKQRQLTCINGSQGYSAETSGGLLMSISAEGAKTFAEEILAILASSMNSCKLRYGHPRAIGYISWAKILVPGKGRTKFTKK